MLQGYADKISIYRRWNYANCTLRNSSSSNTIFTGSLFWFIMGELMILAGGGDLTILLKLLRYKSKKEEILYMDHPYECGLVVFERENNKI